MNIWIRKVSGVELLCATALGRRGFRSLQPATGRYFVSCCGVLVIVYGMSSSRRPRGYSHARKLPEASSLFELFRS